MITDPPPEVPAPNADATIRDTYQKWLNHCMIVHCIMRAIMNDEFRCKFDDAQLNKII